jgi:hypothetical protein
VSAFLNYSAHGSGLAEACLPKGSAVGEKSFFRSVWLNQRDERFTAIRRLLFATNPPMFISNTYMLANHPIIEILLQGLRIACLGKFEH